MECIVAGVPNVTLAGDFPSARVSASILTHLGRPEWIANTEEEYIEKALALMENRAQHDRTEVRKALTSSGLNDLHGYVRAVEEKYEWMMQRYIGGSK